MKIRKRVVYEIAGQSFETFDKARRYEEDLVGRFMELHLLAGLNLSPSERIRLHGNIMRNREKLVELLTVDNVGFEGGEE
jgi:hypothetical protein